MASSIYTVVILLTIAAVLCLIGALWARKIVEALAAFGAVALMGGLLLNLAALRHIGAKSATYSWATLPGWTYTTPVWVGGLLLLFVGSVKLVDIRRKARRARKAAKSGPAPLPVS